MASLALSVPAAASAAPPIPVRISQPRNGAFFSHGPVTVTVEAPASAGHLHVTLAGRNVSGSFARGHSGVWRARLARRLLGSGQKQLVASLSANGGRHGTATTSFTVGHRRRGFLTVGMPRHGRGTVVSLQTERAPDLLLGARLNGRSIAPILGPGRERRRVIRLGADDGLRFGRNVLRVVAAHQDGSYDFEVRHFFIPRDRPLAGAGPARSTAGPSTVALDGTASEPAVQGADLRYRWQVVERPPGSKAKPRDATSARASFHPDALGTYRLRLNVSEGSPLALHRLGRAQTGSPVGTDTTTVTKVADVPPIGMPIETMVFNGNYTEQGADAGIRLGAKTYWLGAPKGNDVQALILDRSTLGVLEDETVPGTEAAAKSLAAKIKEYGKKALVVLAAPRVRFEEEEGISSAFQGVVKLLGASTAALESPTSVMRTGWSVIGVPESVEGAYEGAGTNYAGDGFGLGALDGYLQRDSSNQFAFSPGAREALDTAAPGSPKLHNTIKIGSKGYESAALAGCGSGGFQVEVLAAETLAPISGSTFTTNGCGTAADSVAQQQMAASLNGISLQGAGFETMGTKLVIVQSIGAPRDLSATAWNQIATALERLGGTGAAFAAATGSYALVGQLGIADFPLSESSSTLLGAAAEITALLEPDRVGSFVPVLSSPVGGTSFNLAAVAYQPLQSWPFSETEEDEAALQYIAEDILKLPPPTPSGSCYVPARPDVRSQYCDIDETWQSSAVEKPFVAGHGFDRETWEQVTGELANEFPEVNRVWKMIHNLQRPFGTASNAGSVDLQTLATQIDEALALPPKSEVAGFWLNMVSNLSGLAGYFVGEDFEGVVGALSGAMAVSAQLQNEEDGSPALAKFKLRSGELAMQLAERYVKASSGLGQLGELVVSDYGKLQAISESPEIALTESTIAGATEKLRLSSRQWIYETLLPVAYEAIELQQGETENNPLPENADEYECEFFEQGGGAGGYKPFDAPKSAQFLIGAPAKRLGVLVESGSELPSAGNPEHHPRSPTQALMEPLFKSASEGGLGLKEPWLWHSAFDFPSATAKTVRCP